MATETEVGLRVEDFMGVNAQVSSEDLQDYFYKQTQNLYERKLGEVQRRGGSALLSPAALPSNVLSIDNEWVLKDRILGKTKVLKCQVNQSYTPAAFPQVTASFVTDAILGKWGSSPVGAAGTMIGANWISLVATGFASAEILTLATGLPVAGDTKKLVVTIASPLGDSNFTGIDVYANVTFSYNGATAQTCDVFVGHIDLVATPTGTYNFLFGPIHLFSDPGVVVDLGGSSTFTAVSGFDSSSTLVSGKTYYVTLLSQRLFYAPGGPSAGQCHFTNSSYAAVTIAPGHNCIYLSKTGGGSAASMFAIGLHPQTMQPTGIWSQNATFSNQVISKLTRNQVGTVFVENTGASTTSYRFRCAQIGQQDMFARLNGNTWEAMPINNWQNKYTRTDTPPLSTERFWETSSPNVNKTTITSGGKYTAEPWYHATQDLLFMTAKDGYSDASTSYAPYTHSLLQCDGCAVSLTVIEFGSAAPPKGSFLKAFKEKLVLAGGSADAYNKLHFSLPFNPYNWGVPGASSTLQYVQVESGGEGISGIGAYTNTTGTAGPVSQLLIGKRHSLFILTDLPTYTSGSNNNAIMTQLSAKVGIANHHTIVNTELGTIITAEDNVYLVRESGEPTPLGDAITNFLKSETPGQTIDPTYWSASYHDGHYKLAYSAPNSSIADHELWLDIRKMKAMKGQPCWMGPHVGREIAYSMVEEQFLDTIMPKRICVDRTNKRWYQADKEDVVQDFSTDITTVLELRDYPLGEPNSNKIFTRTYWKMKVDQDFTVSELTTTLNEAGETTETKNLSFTKIPGYSGGTYAGFLSSRAKIYQFFPTLRLRGETIRKKLTYTGQVFFAISGFTLFYRTEGRRVG